MTVVSPAGQQDDGRRSGLAAQSRLAGDAGHHPADLARLALERVAQDERGDPGRRATSAAASSESCGAAIMTVSAPASRGSPGFGVSSAARSRCVDRRRAAP